MLANARKYKEALSNKMLDAWYDDTYKYYFNSNWHDLGELPDSDWDYMCFASVDKHNEVIGYISYKIDRTTDSAYSLGAINFSDKIALFGLDLCKVVQDIFCKYNLQRLEFEVVEGNPAESSYDRLVSKYGGRIVGIRKNAAKLMDNKLYTVKIYEILREDYMHSKC